MPVSADIVLRTSFLSIATWLNSKQAGSASEVAEGPQDMDTDSGASVPDLNAAEAREQSTAQDEIIKKVMQELVFHSRAEVSCWLSSYPKMGKGSSQGLRAGGIRSQKWGKLLVKLIPSDG